MDEMVDKRLFEDLAARKPEEVILPPFIEYNDSEKCYLVKVWDKKITVYPDQKKAKAVAGTSESHGFFYVFLINYLLSQKSSTPTNKWLSEKDLVGGATFFRGPHTVPTDSITKSFANDIDLLKKRCEQLGGVALEMADCSYSFDIIGSVKVAMLYWAGDEDFPAEAKLLIDSSVSGSLALDVIYGLFCDICMRIADRS